MANQKIVGQSCENNCGGKYVQNPKTGKVFCENKCWLNGGKPAGTNEPFRTPGENKKAEEEKWEQISRGKVRHGFSIEAYKMGKTLDIQTKLEIDEWTNYVMKG